ncbi:MAG: hypothetical protein WBO49_00010 [Candidatus Saccharimonas sp.]
MYLHDPSVKYDLLRLVISLWITFIALVVMIKHRFPNKIVHHTVNVCLGIAAVLQFVAIVYISLRFSF